MMYGKSAVQQTFVAVAFVALASTPQTAGAQTPVAELSGFNQDTGIYEMVFPIIGDVNYSDTFGAPRSNGRTHEGTDIFDAYGDRGAPVVAVADGTVGGIYPEPGGWFQGEGECCAMTLEHDDGWSSLYIHLNNDTEGTDDGLGWGFAEGIEPGIHVVAGQLIGWLGDSGNAESCNCPHVHFELHDPNNVVINPYTHLLEAAVLTEAGGEVIDHGIFTDDDGSVHEKNINELALRGITKGCNPPTNDNFCPSQELTRGEIAAFFRRYLALPSSESDYFVDDASSIFENDINALAEAGIAFGCAETEYCATAPLRREELAELLTRTFGYTTPDGADTFTDDEGPFATSIEAIAAVGVTLGCNPPENDQFCPERTLIRAEMASFMMRAIRLQEAG